MLDRLPNYIDPLYLAEKRSVLKGDIPLNSFDRLADMLLDDSGGVSIFLSFGKVGKQALIEGKIESVLTLVCQNCLQALAWPIDHTLKLGLVNSIDEADRLPENYDPLLLKEDKILLKDIIEEELLLILPQYPKHQHDCLNRDKGAGKTDKASKHKQTTTKENPFSILSNLKSSEIYNGSTKK
ncbi:MAG: YceD family protein [Gammaproteobacteria bacterium]